MVERPFGKTPPIGGVVMLGAKMVRRCGAEQRRKFRSIDYAIASCGPSVFRCCAGGCKVICVDHQTAINIAFQFSSDISPNLTELHDLKNEDETETYNTSELVRTGCKRHLLGDTEAIRC